MKLKKILAHVFLRSQTASKIEKPLVVDTGKNNKIIFIKNGKKYTDLSLLHGLTINFTGDNNVVKIHLPNYFESCSLTIDSHHSVVEIGADSTIYQLQIHLDKGQNESCLIGSHLYVGSTEIYLGDHTSVKIGDHCLLSWNLDIRADDGHVVFDKETKQVLNRQRNTLTIGDYCWIGFSAKLLKNTILPNHSIVGEGSVVVDCFTEEYTAIGGNPAVVFKKNVDWANCKIIDFEKNKAKKQS